MAKAIKSLNTKKAPDADGLTAEHIKNAGILMTGALTKIVNAIFREKKIPKRLKLGILTPIWKKNDKKLPTNYRGITVISIIGKLVEVLLREEVAPILAKTQNPLQRGFTRGTSPLHAAIMLQEAVMEAYSTKKPLYVALLDAKSAFDVVSHDSLLRKLFVDGIQGSLWSTIADTFKEAHTVVKWEGHLSPEFTIEQGVRQGGILSTEEYKRYVNDLLDRLETLGCGARIGDIKCVAPTCADDVALLANTSEDLQAILDQCYIYSQNERYQLQPVKSMVLIYNSSRIPLEHLKANSIFNVGGTAIPIVSWNSL